MEECKRCKLAIYCYSDSSTWIFRTKQEMEEKLAEIEDCPLHEQVKRTKTVEGEACSEAGTG